jgi:hypothetical protein
MIYYDLRACLNLPFTFNIKLNPTILKNIFS